MTGHLHWRDLSRAWRHMLEAFRIAALRSTGEWKAAHSTGVDTERYHTSLGHCFHHWSWCQLSIPQANVARAQSTLGPFTLELAFTRLADHITQPKSWIVFSALNIALEVALFLYPLYLVWDLQMSMKSKATVIIGFALRIP